MKKKASLERNLSFARRLLGDSSLLSVRSALKRQHEMLQTYASLYKWQSMFHRPRSSKPVNILIGYWEYQHNAPAKFRIACAMSNPDGTIDWGIQRIPQTAVSIKIAGWIYPPPLPPPPKM